MIDFFDSLVLTKPYRRNLYEAFESRPKETESKLKLGLSGYANGARVSALADTGSIKNMLSASYTEKLGLKVEGRSSEFVLGNSRKIQSIGMFGIVCVQSIQDGR